MPEVIPTVSEFRFVRIKRTFQQFALISSARKFNPHSYEPLDDWLENHLESKNN